MPDDSFVAVLEALAELSILNPPRYKVRTVYGEDYGKNVRKILKLMMKTCLTSVIGTMGSGFSPKLTSLTLDRNKMKKTKE